MNNTVVSPDMFLINDEGRYEWTPNRATAAWDQAYKAWRTVLQKTYRSSSRRSAALLIGIPGSGKTTWLALGTESPPQHFRDEVEGPVFDATLTTSVSRRPLLEMARQENVRVEAIIFNTPLVIALERNATRSPERRVPTDTMFRMARQLEEEPPTLTEGFWRITSAFRE